MIKAVTGFPGSGKTFYCTNSAFHNIKSGRLVFSNYALKGAYQITFDDLVNYRFPVGSLVIIDEAGRWFNSRKWSSLPSEVFDLFTLHRHMELDLIVAVQNFNRIDVALREVIEIVIWSHNPMFLPWFKYYFYYDVDKVGSMNEDDILDIERIYKKHRSRKLYDTHAMSKITEEKAEIPLIPWTEEGIKTDSKKWLFKQKMKRIISRIIKRGKKKKSKST